ncbi:hypothetical protein HMSSN139_66120 [Paenibacillus sp. HMSSN-139]|nr:hypothetical protein HMSSN139_66120 [Paenibacillus sp. HMSSN-139]
MITKGHFLLMEVGEFKSWLANQKITRKITRLQVHHTWKPNYTTRINQDPFTCLEGMRRDHLAKGWNGTGQNITIFEDGKIAISLDRDLNQTPAGISGANTGALCIENIGNFDKGGDTMTVAQIHAITHVYACLLDKLNLPADTEHIVYHAWYSPTGAFLGDYVPGRSSKTCPGTNFWGDGNTKVAANKGFIPAVKEELDRLKGVEPDLETAKVYVNGEKIEDGFILEGRVYVPLRAACEALGAKVGWDNKTKTAELTK